MLSSNGTYNVDPSHSFAERGLLSLVCHTVTAAVLVLHHQTAVPTD